LEEQGLVPDWSQSESFITIKGVSSSKIPTNSSVTWKVGFGKEDAKHEWTVVEANIKEPLIIGHTDAAAWASNIQLNLDPELRWYSTSFMTAARIWLRTDPGL
jgi:hypothetical protein